MNGLIHFQLNQQVCPSREQLRARLDGELVAYEVASLDSHVENCTVCQAALEDIAGSIEMVQHREDSAHFDVKQMSAEICTVLSSEFCSQETKRNHANLRAFRELDRQLNEKDLPLPLNSICVQEVLGQGGMGVVFRAYDQATHRTMAIKVLRNRYLQNEEVQHQFLREARVQEQMLGPGVAEIFSTGKLGDGRSFIAMEFLAGKTLSLMMRERSIACDYYIDEAVRPFLQVCDVVRRAHNNGIVHRDLKPANILLGQGGDAYVVDWGLAIEESRPVRSPLPDAISKLCRTVVGTPGFSAPEQLRGESATPQSDIYSLGVILAELLLLESLVENESWMESDKDFDRFRDRAIVKLQQNLIPLELIEVIDQCLELDPNSRFASVSEMAMSIQATLHAGSVVSGVSRDARPRMASPTTA
ncbi:serine/threonine-protein kinase [Bremerella sp. JC770]|uniref:serine/threonine-protein kinase n=1 Tax=Bremerella sp. JC770 TaxID=3232137 RepID=UPI003459467D